MAGIGAITVPAAGVVTAPTSFPLTLNSVPIATVRTNEALYTSVLLTGSRGAMFANGFGFVLHIVKGTVMATGLIAPETAPGVAFTSPGAKASRVITTTGNFTNGDRIDLVSAGDQDKNNWAVKFVSAFSTSGDDLKFYQVLIGASASATLDNLVACINATSGDGSTYQSPRLLNGTQTTDHPKAWSDWITATKSSASTVTFTAVHEGTQGNSYESREVTDGGGTYSFPATVFAGGAAGSGTSPSAGARSWGYVYKRSLDGARSGVSPLTSKEVKDAGSFDLTSLADPPAGLLEQIDAKCSLRTTKDAAQLYDVYDVVVADTTDTDDASDATIAANEAYDPSLYRPYTDGGVPRYRILVPYKGMILGMGNVPTQEYSIGTAAVTITSSSVTLSSAAKIRRVREGQEFRVTTTAATEADRYRIVWIDEASRILHLNRPYEGGTNATATYAIRDARDPFVFGHSEPNLPNLWPTKNEYEGITSSDARGVTAAIPAFGMVIAFTRTGIWSISGSYGALRVKNEYEGAGCVGPKAVVATADDGRLIFVSDAGVYEWNGPGSGDPVCISHGKTLEGAAWGIGETVRRINRTHAHGVFVHRHPTRNWLRILVPLDSDWTNRYALVYDLTSKVWTVDDVPDLTYVMTAQDDAGTSRVLAGDIQGNVWELDVSNSDGAYGFEPHQVVASGTSSTATSASTPFPTGIEGCPVTLVRVATGEIEQNTIASRTSAALTFTRYTTALAAGDYVCVGAIPMFVKSGKGHHGSPSAQKSMFMVDVAFSTDGDGTYYMAFAADQDDVTVTSSSIQGDLTLTSGKDRFFASVFGRSLQWAFLCFEPGCDPTLLDVELGIEQMAGVRG